MCTSSPGRVSSIREDGGIVVARVSFDLAPDQTCLSYVDGIAPGDFVLVAGGAVVERISGEEAAVLSELSAAMLEALAEIQDPAGGSPS